MHILILLQILEVYFRGIVTGAGTAGYYEPELVLFWGNDTCLRVVSVFGNVYPT